MANKISSKATGTGLIRSIVVVSNSSPSKKFDICKKGAPVQFKYY